MCGSQLNAHAARFSECTCEEWLDRGPPQRTAGSDGGVAGTRRRSAGEALRLPQLQPRVPQGLRAVSHAQSGDAMAEECDAERWRQRARRVRAIAAVSNN